MPDSLAPAAKEQEQAGNEALILRHSGNLGSQRHVAAYICHHWDLPRTPGGPGESSDHPFQMGTCVQDINQVI